MLALFLSIVLACLIFIWVGHTLEKTYPDLPSPHHPNNADKKYTALNHYGMELLLGLCISMGVVMLIGFIIGFFVVFPIYLLHDWYKEWKRQESELLVGFDVPRNPLFPIGSPAKFAAIVASRTLVIGIGVWLFSYLFGYIGWLAVIGSNPKNIEAYNQNVLKGGFDYYAQQTLFYVLGFCIFFFAAIIVVSIASVIKYGIEGLRYKWEVYKEFNLSKRG